MEKHAIPQNIMDVEFKLFGELTVRQFGYVAGGGFAALFFWFIFSSLPLLRIVLVGISLVLGISLALVKVNNQPFETWLSSYILALFSSQKRIWKKDSKVPKYLAENKMDIKSYTKTEAALKNIGTTDVVQQQGLDYMPHAVDTSSSQVSEKAPPANQSTTDSQGGNVTDLPQTPVDPYSMQGTKPVSPPSASPESQNVGEPPKNQEESKNETMVDNIPQTPALPNIPTPSPAINIGQSMPPVTVQPYTENNPTNMDFSVDLAEENQNSQNAVADVPGVSTPYDTETTQQVVPLQPVQAQNVESNLINEIVPSIEESQTNPIDETPPESSPKEEDESLREENRQLRNKVADYSNDVIQLKDQLQTSTSQYEQVNQQNQTLKTQMDELQTQLNSLKNQVTTQPVAPEVQPIVASPVAINQESVPIKTDDTLFTEKSLPPSSSPSVAPGQAKRPNTYNGPSLTKKSNVVSGIVKDSQGKLLSDVIVIIKRQDTNRAVSANKTNSLGQFVSSSTLEDGEYLINLTKSDHGFDTYEITLNGQVIPTFEFTAN